MSIRKHSYEYEKWLRRRYPRAFNRRRPPLLIGIKQHLLDDPTRPDWADEKVVQDALARWVRHFRYNNLLHCDTA